MLTSAWKFGINEEMARALDNVAEIVKDGLCTGCGTCAGVCPTEAIRMRVLNGVFLPEIEEDKCTSCRLCVKCCPGYSLNFDELNFNVFGRQPVDTFLGNCFTCYVGHSNDDEIRYDSSSGGLVTQLLIFALERGLIDGALVVRMRQDSPLEPEPFIARTREEVISASKSKYCPVAVNEGLKDIVREDGRFAVVGLPCHIHGIRKAEMSVKGLREKIVLHIGLFCSHTVSFFGTEFLLGKLGVKSDQVVKVDYRGLGWPGSLLVRLRDGSSLMAPYVGEWNSYWPLFSSFFFTPKRCLMCFDETNELADVSVGDAWLPELRKEKKGESIVIARTKRGKEFLKEAASSGAISLRRIDCERVRCSQAGPLSFKKEDLGTRFAMMGSRGMKVPVFTFRPRSSSSFFSFARNLFVFLNVRASENETLRGFLRGVPFPVFRLYYGLYKFLLLF